MRIRIKAIAPGNLEEGFRPAGYFGNTKSHIGKYAFIGAGAVITKAILPYELWVGNPAKHLGWMSEFGSRLIFDSNGIAKCEESGEKYKLDKDNRVNKIN